MTQYLSICNVCGKPIRRMHCLDGTPHTRVTNNDYNNELKRIFEEARKC